MKSAMAKIILSLLFFACLPLMGADKKPLTRAESAKAIEAAIRKELKKPTGKLTKADLKKVTSLGLIDKQLNHVPEGLEKLDALTHLALDHNQLSNVKGLEKLTQLTHLSLFNNQLADMKGLEKLTQLKVLVLAVNQLADVKDLEKLTQLKTLWLQGNSELTKAQVNQLKKALPKCNISSNPRK